MTPNILDKTFPEWREILQKAGGYKPRKFTQAIKVISCPATFNPSEQGDFAFTHSFLAKDGKISPGPAYAYDSMLSSRVNPYERPVDVPKGTRLWIVTYDGQWGGYWSRVNVYVHQEQLVGKDI